MRSRGEKLSSWARQEFGNIRKKKNELFEKLEVLQNSTHSVEINKEMKRVEVEIENILKKEETMWFQRSRALWLKDGDKNSAFFHEKASHRKRRNTIKSIEDADGVFITKHEEIAKVMRDYFIQIFSKENL